MVNYIYDPFRNWEMFNELYIDPKLGIKAFLDIKQRLLIDKYILSMKRCEDILNQKDEFQRLNAVNFVDSMVIVGDMIYSCYLKSLKDKSLRDLCSVYFLKEINRINRFMNNIYSDYHTITRADVNRIIKEYK